MKNNNNLILLSSFSLLAFIGGCATHSVNSPNVISEQYKVKGSFEEGKELLEAKKLKEPKFGQLVNDFYVDTNAVGSLKKFRLSLPREFHEDVVIKFRSGVSFADLTALIYESSGLKVEFPEELEFGEEEDESGAQPAPPPPAQPEVLGAITPNSDGSMNEGSFSSMPASAEMPGPIPEDDIVLKQLNYNGNLIGLMDELSAKLGLKWRYDEDLQKVFFYKYETMTFYVYSSRKDMETSTQITTETKSQVSTEDSSQGSSSGKTSMKIKIDDEYSNWEDVVGSVDLIVGDGGAVNYVKQQGKVIVTADDYTLGKVKSFINDVNKDARTQVIMNVVITNVKTVNSSNIGLDLTNVNDVLAAKLGLGSFSFSASSASGIGPAVSVASKNASTSAIVEALSSFGTIKNSTAQSFVVKNNQSYPIQIVKNTTYISDYTVTTDGASEEDGAPLVETQTDSVMDGITYTFTPSVVGNSINLEYNSTITSLDSLDEAPGGIPIQLPVTSNKNLYQEMIIPDGQPRVVSIIEKENATTSVSGPLSPMLWLLGGKEESSNTKEYIIVTVTGYIQR